MVTLFTIWVSNSWFKQCNAYESISALWGLVSCRGFVGLKRVGKVCTNNLYKTQVEYLVGLWSATWFLPKDKKKKPNTTFLQNAARKWHSPNESSTLAKRGRPALSGWAWHAFINKKKNLLKVNVEIFFYHSESMRFAHLKNITNFPVPK